MDDLGADGRNRRVFGIAGASFARLAEYGKYLEYIHREYANGLYRVAGG